MVNEYSLLELRLAAARMDQDDFPLADVINEANAFADFLIIPCNSMSLSAVSTPSVLMSA